MRRAALPILGGAALAAVTLVVYVLATHHVVAAPAAQGSSTPTSAAATAALTPTAVDIPAISAHSSLVQTGLNPDNTLEVPPLDQPGQASWYRNSPVPGNPGPAVILGHVNANGSPGVFARLSDLKVGDQVSVTRSDGTTAVFAVYRMRTYLKTAFPTAEVYGNTQGPELRLITCGGALDTNEHSYLSNVVAYARAA